MRVLKTALAAAATVAAWATLIERQLFTLRKLEATVLPAGSTPLRVLHLSDLHLAPWQRRKIAWVKHLAQLRPDLIVLTGDLFGHKNALTSLRDCLEPLCSQGIPLLYVHGSNDYYAPRVKNYARYLFGPSKASKRKPDLDIKALEALLDGFDGINLNNRADTVQVAGTQFTVLGFNDPHIGYANQNALEKALSKLPAAAAEYPRLGVVHAPYQRELNFLTDANCAMIFAGHTHGGQVRIPGIGALTANCDLPVSQARGLSVWHTANRATFLQVSAGLGHSIFAPFRLACRPEATLTVLLPSDSNSAA